MSQRPCGEEVISETRRGVREGLREVAITLWECERRRRARVRPRPEEVPVMSQVRGRCGEVDIVCWSGWALVRLEERWTGVLYGFVVSVLVSGAWC